MLTDMNRKWVTYQKSFLRQFGDNKRYLSIAVKLLNLSAYKEQIETYICIEMRILS